MNGFAEQPALFTRLLRDAARRAEEMLTSPDDAARLRRIADDGFSEIERFELSPLAEDQFVAVALRLSGSGTAALGVAERLDRHFSVPPSSFALEAQRRAIWNQGEERGLSLDLAARPAAAIEERLAATDEDLAGLLRAHAALYAGLWCDPRIGASASARREMLALVSLLHARVRSLRGVVKRRRSRS